MRLTRFGRDNTRAKQAHGGWITTLEKQRSRAKRRREQGRFASLYPHTPHTSRSPAGNRAGVISAPAFGRGAFYMTQAASVTERLPMRERIHIRSGSAPLHTEHTEELGALSAGLWCLLGRRCLALVTHPKRAQGPPRFWCRPTTRGPVRPAATRPRVNAWGRENGAAHMRRVRPRGSPALGPFLVQVASCVPVRTLVSAGLVGN